VDEEEYDYEEECGDLFDKFYEQGSE